MVFSAPEMTTVSKPKRNPASAEVSDQKKMRPFISGSNVPSSESAHHDKHIALGTQICGSGIRSLICLSSGGTSLIGYQSIPHQKYAETCHKKYAETCTWPIRGLERQPCKWQARQRF